MPTADATRPAAATARSSAGTTRRPTSSWARASATPSSMRRGRSTTTVPPRLLAAASTARTACGDGDAVAAVPTEHPERVQFGQGLLQGAAADPAARGGERGPAQALRRLAAEEYVESAAQRIRVHQEGAQPSRAEVTASAQASVDAPAPPLPPMTPTVSAGRPTPSATSAMRSTSHCSPSGSIRTWSAPISTARRQTPESS